MSDKGAKAGARRNRTSVEKCDEESFLNWAEEHPKRADVSARYQRDYVANRRRPSGKAPIDNSGELAPAATGKQRGPKLPRSDVPETTALGQLGIARIICAEPNPPNWLAVGLQENYLRLQVGSYELKKRSSEDIRAEMGRILKATKILQDLLKDSELQSLLSEDFLPNRNRFFAGLNWIAKRAAAAAVKKKQGRPKKVSDLLSMQYCCAVVISAAWLEVRGELLSGSNIEGQEACEAFWKMMAGRQKHNKWVIREGGSLQRGVTSTKSYGAWKKWLEKARIIVEASRQDDVFPAKRTWESSRRNSVTGELVEIERDGVRIQSWVLNEDDRLHLKFVRDVRKIFQSASVSDKKEKS